VDEVVDEVVDWLIHEVVD